MKSWFFLCLSFIYSFVSSVVSLCVLAYFRVTPCLCVCFAPCPLRPPQRIRPPHNRPPEVERRGSGRGSSQDEEAVGCGAGKGGTGELQQERTVEQVADGPREAERLKAMPYSVEIVFNDTCVNGKFVFAIFWQDWRVLFLPFVFANFQIFAKIIFGYFPYPSLAIFMETNICHELATSYFVLLFVRPEKKTCHIWQLIFGKFLRVVKNGPSVVVVYVDIRG